MPDVLMRETSPYGTRRASLLKGDGDTYLYLEDLAGPVVETASAVWVANHLPAPADPGIPSSPGSPPRMGATGTRHPEGCPELDGEVGFVWFEEGDAVALIDGDGLVAAIPGWGGAHGFYGYSRNAKGQSALAWELNQDATEAIERKVHDSSEFWAWRADGAWPEIRSAGLSHLDQAVGPQEAAWPVGDASFPEVIASRHRIEGHNIWVTATTGLSAQRMPAVEQHMDDPEVASRIELAIARAVPDRVGADLLGALAAVPFGRCTWLGEGHTVGGTRGAYPAFGNDKASLILTKSPPAAPDLAVPDLSGLVQRGGQVSFLWVMLIDEETFAIARGRDARAALVHLAATGRTWIQ